MQNKSLPVYLQTSWGLGHCNAWQKKTYTGPCIKKLQCINWLCDISTSSYQSISSSDDNLPRPLRGNRVWDGCHSVQGFTAGLTDIKGLFLNDSEISPLTPIWDLSSHCLRLWFCHPHQAVSGNFCLFHSADIQHAYTAPSRKLGDPASWREGRLGVFINKCCNVCHPAERSASTHVRGAYTSMLIRP